MKLINAIQMMFEESEAYISAQAQITDKVTRDINYVVHWKLQQLLDDAPAVDAVEVVRCKDCEFWEKQSDSAQGRCFLGGRYPTGAWYCANGRRRQDDDRQR